MEWISVKDRLPEDGQWVLGHFPNEPWICDSPSFQKSAIVQFLRGDSNPTNIIKSADRHGGNLVPYEWQTFGPSSFYGQEASHWMPLPTPPLLSQS